ncbi:MAG: acyl-CoA dehydrogenase family protein [Planctomycetota bacterium]
MNRSADGSADPVLPDSELDARDRAFAQRIRDFAREELLPHARVIDEEERFRPEMVEALATAGILGGPISRDDGGSGWTAFELALAHEEIGSVCGNARGFLAVHTGLVSQCLERNGSETQKREILPALVAGTKIGCFGLTEADAGSDIGAMATTATAVDGGFVLRGRKIWITNGGIADVALVFANADPARGKDGITAFLIDTSSPGLRRTRMPGRDLGHRGSDHAQLEFEGVFVPTDRVVGQVGDGFRIALDGLHHGRLSVAAGAVGIHRAALAASRDFATKRVQFGRTIDRFQMVQERLADMTVELLAARALVWRCAHRRDRGLETPLDIAAAKLYATEAAARACDQAVILHGGRGYSTEYPVERLLRDVMGLRIYEGTTLIQKGLVARAVTATGTQT